MEVLTDAAALNEAVGLITFCLMTASLSHFLEATMEEGMIFERYRNMLLRIYDKRHPVLRKLVKPIGLCIYCYGAWVFVFSYLFNYSFEIGSIMLGLGMNYLFIEFIFKWVKRDC